MIKKRNILIAPSILSADLAKLGEDVANVIAAGADLIHFDVMDQHYVPNLTFGPSVCSALRHYGITKPIDVHLMAEPVDDLIRSFAAAGATAITIHPETTKHLARSLTLIRDLGCRAGIALNPATPLTILDYIWEQLDLILLMTVNPGFGGQKLIPAVLPKITAVRQAIQQHASHPIFLAIDGGVNLTNCTELHERGADILVVGSALFKADQPYADTIQKLRGGE